MRASRRWPVAVLLLAAVGACSSRPAAPACAPDALVVRSLHDLASFTGWLDRHAATGVVGEVGWPAGPQWEELADRWAQAAEQADVGVLVWAAAERWAPDYPLAVYRSAGGTVLDTAGPQAKVVEDSIVGRPRSGVSLADGSFGAAVGPGSDDSAALPGEYGRDYSYPSRQSLAWLAERGVRSVRLSFAWERVQSRPTGPLVGREVDRLRAVLRDADATGLSVVLDLHSYGRFAVIGPDGTREVLELGSAALPAEALAMFWGELARAVRDEPALAGYGLSNEPHDLPGGIATWQRASQLSVDAIRDSDSETPVYVAGYAFSSAARWQDEQQAPWIADGSGPVVYEAHQYFDTDRSGTYARSYDDEVRAAEEQGWTACSRTGR